MARPSKLTPRTEDIICDALRTGMTRTGAAGVARVSYVTFLSWLKQGKEANERVERDPATSLTDDERRYLSFFTAVSEAEAQIEQEYTTIIYNAAQEDPSHAWRWLQARRRQDYGPPTTQAVQVVENVSLSLDEWRKEREARLRRADERMAIFRDE